MTDNPEKPALTQATSDVPADANKGWPLPVLVALGLLASLVVLVLIGWYFSVQEFNRQCGANCSAWALFPPLTQDGMFAVIRNTVTAAAALGLGVTIVLSYRRQRVAEQTLIYTAETQRLAVEAQSLATQRLNRESLDTLRQRYLDIATLLNTKNDLNKITALHALESLTISWRQFGNDREASAALGLLLSTARLTDREETPNLEFMATMARTLDRHMQIEVTTGAGWGGLTVDATRCLASRGIRDWIVRGGDLTASPRSNDEITVNGLNINGGKVRLVSTYEAPRDNSKGSRVQNLTLIDGRLELHALTADQLCEVTVMESELSGGEISFGSPRSAEIQRRIYYENCSFKGTTLLATVGYTTEFHFKNCTFEARIGRNDWRVSDDRTATFTNCVGTSAGGEVTAIENLDDLYALFPNENH